MTDKQYPSNLYLESAATNIDFAKRVSVEAVIVMAQELLALRKAVNIPQGWTMNHVADAALVMLDRIDTLHPEDGDRIEEVKLVIRSMAADIASKPDLTK